MRARALIGGATFTPERLKVVYEAFDRAWDELKPGISDRPQGKEAARMKLAQAVLNAAADETVNREQITARALQIMRAAPTELQ